MKQLKNSLTYYSLKVIAFFFSVLILSFAVFYISRLAPTDPLQSYYGDRVEKMSTEEKHLAKEKLGLTQPIYEQYIQWAQHALHGDFGISYQYKQDVKEVICLRIGNTLLLGGIGFVLTFAGALVLGILCAWLEDRWPDRLLCKIGTFLSCIPEFWLSLALLFVFSVTLHWLPSSGAYSLGNASDPADRIVHLILPLTALLSGHLWYYAYMIRSQLLEEVCADYVLLGKAKGLRTHQILFRHCLRNILPSYISMMAISVPHILGGTYIIETVFSYPGIGTLSYESARYADYNLLMLLCMLTGVIVIFCNMLGQMINEQIDPRMKATQAAKNVEVTIK